MSGTSRRKLIRCGNALSKCLRPRLLRRVIRTVQMFHVKHLFRCHASLRQLFHVKQSEFLKRAQGISARTLPTLFAPSDALALAFALAFALALATPFAKVALADDGNEVNPQQLPDSSFIYDTSIADLAGADAYYNDQTVQVVGEVVGDAINVTLDGTHKWITLEATSASGASGATSASGATITVFMTSDAAERIDTFGAYGKTGTILQVRGTFHLACREHDGLTDLHADHVSVVKKGEAHADEFDWWSFFPGAACLAVGLLLLFVFNHLRERQR